MNSFINDYVQLDGLGLQELLKNKEISQKEVFDCSQSLIEMLNPKLNFTSQKFDTPFSSKKTKLQIPFLLKDCGLNIKGVETTYATASLKGKLSSETSPLTQTYIDMGLSIVARTTTPEFCTVGVTESKLYGKTLNPWNLKYTSGGSSGGSGTALAARVAPISFADDGGGSIRIPAAYCGLIGLKPTIGVTSPHKINYASWMGLVAQHVLTRTTRDSLWALIESSNKKTVKDLYNIDQSDYSIKELLNSKKKLKIAFSKSSFYNSPTDPLAAKAVDSIITLLKKNGHSVEEVNPELNHENIKKAYLYLVCQSIFKQVESLKIKKLNFKSIEPSNWLLYMIGKKTPKNTLSWALKQCEVVRNDLDHFFTKFDLYVNPATALPAGKVGHMDLSFIEKTVIKNAGLSPNVEILYNILNMASKKGLARTPNTQFSNLSGHPSIVVPSDVRSNNVPLGVQITGKFYSEIDLFQISQEVENEIMFYKNIPQITKDCIGL